MKRYLIITLTSLVMLSCNQEIIEITDPQAVTAGVALRTTAGIDALMRSAYRRMHEFNYYGQNQLLAPEAMADNLVIANNTGRYTNHVVNAVNTHMGRYDRWSTINDVNLAIKYVDAAEPTSTTEDPVVTQNKRNYLKGEALFLRALVYHDMVKVYGYEPGMEVDGWDLGVILRTTPTEGATDANLRARSTVTEVYTQIKTDLTDAIALLPAEATLAAADRIYRASKAAAKALLARVYLYERSYALANTLATEAIAETAKVLVPAASYAASWNQSNHPESVFELDIRVADWSTVDGVNNSMASLTNTTPNGIAAGGAQFAVCGSAELKAAHEAGDIRSTLWVANSGRWECKKWRGELGDFRENIPVIRVSELYLIAAEARANNSDDPGAQTMVNALRAQRGLAATALTGQALKDLILNENRVEFSFEGHRWFDLKRLGMDFPKPAALGVSTLPYDDYRVLGPLPSAEVILNPLLVQNPNY
jgi:starch-binding outer membrane protein, SusD/RagB family